RGRRGRDRRIGGDGADRALARRQDRARPEPRCPSRADAIAGRAPHQPVRQRARLRSVRKPCQFPTPNAQLPRNSQLPTPNPWESRSKGLSKTSDPLGVGRWQLLGVWTLGVLGSLALGVRWKLGVVELGVDTVSLTRWPITRFDISD